MLDLYAGSGALGLEALSRGAAAVVFVESAPRVLPVLRANLAAVGLPGAPGASPGRCRPSSRGRAAGRSTWCSPIRRTRPRPRRSSTCSARSHAAAGWPPRRWSWWSASSREEPWEWPTPLAGLRDRRYGEAVLRYGRCS